MTDQCGNEARDTYGWARICFLPKHGPEEPHTDQHGYRWQDAHVILGRLQEKWKKAPAPPQRRP